MATLIHGFRDTTGFHPGAGLRGVFTRIAAYRATRRARRQVLRDLDLCSDRDLRDLNINRYDFESIADGTFRR